MCKHVEVIFILYVARWKIYFGFFKPLTVRFVICIFYFMFVPLWQKSSINRAACFNILFKSFYAPKNLRASFKWQTITCILRVPEIESADRDFFKTLIWSSKIVRSTFLEDKKTMDNGIRNSETWNEWNGFKNSYIFINCRTLKKRPHFSTVFDTLSLRKLRRDSLLKPNVVFWATIRPFLGPARELSRPRKGDSHSLAANAIRGWRIFARQNTSSSSWKIKLLIVL